MRARGTDRILPAIITLLALADGLLHLRLDYALFGGKLWGAPSFGGPPLGASPRPAGVPSGGPLPGFKPPALLPGVSLPLNELFLLNFLGYFALAVIFYLVLRFRARWLWLVEVALILYALVSIIGWVRIGGPNPQGLGYLSKGLEVALIVALVAHLTSLFRHSALRLQPA